MAAPTKGDFMAALAAAAEETYRGDEGEATGTEGTATAEATETVEEPTSSTEEATNTEETAETTEASSEATTEASAEGTEDVPTEYFGTDLSEFEPEVRKAIIEMVAPRDKHIQQLLREKAAESKAETPAETAPPAAETPAEVSDQDILAALSLDPESDSDEAKAIVALGRLVLDLQNEVKDVANGVSVRETEHYWDTTLNAMEEQYGKLPPGVDRTEVYRVAVENGIAEPMDAYWRIMGPARQSILEAVKTRREEAAKALKTQQAPQKPKASAPTEDVALESKTVRDATKEAALKVIQDLGLNFDSE